MTGTRVGSDDTERQREPVDQNVSITMIEDVRQLLVETLALDEDAVAATPDAPLIGEVPELDSMGVLAVLEAIEERFGFEVDGDEVTVETLETLGSLTALVEAKCG